MENVFFKPPRTFLLLLCTLQWTWHLLAAQSIPDGTLKEYCFPESFNATCGPNEVIMMTAAKYGRMKLGKCLTSDFSIGCHADVLTHTDRKCSGKQSCYISIPDTSLHEVQPCTKDLLAYLEASYKCVQVAQLPRVRCRSSQVLKLTQPSGYIASSVTAVTNQGSMRCPWVIEVPKGQRVNISLFDFGVSQPTRYGVGVCQKYAVIKEKDTSSDLTVCSGSKRERAVYVSETNTITVTILNDQTKDPSKFLFHFTAIGCPDQMSIPYATTKRNGNQMTVSCRNDNRVWHLVCNGQKWVGEVKNCTPTVDPILDGWNTDETVEFPYGLIVAVIIGVILGIILGLTLLAFVMCYQRRRRLVKQQKEYAYASDNTWRRQQFGTYDTTMPNKTSEYGYSHVWDMRDRNTTHAGVHIGPPPQFKPNPEKPEEDRITMRSKEHTYESPNFNNDGVRNNNMEVPYYHEFDATLDRELVTIPDNRT